MIKPYLLLPRGLWLLGSITKPLLGKEARAAPPKGEERRLLSELLLVFSLSERVLHFLSTLGNPVDLGI